MDISSIAIKNYLKSKLPSYMIPNYFIKIDSLPLTKNGKLDRKALPEPNLKDLIMNKYVAPETDTERIICKIYSEVFEFEENEIGRMTDFFEIGGNSMNAIRVSSMIEKQLRVILILRKFSIMP